MNDPLRSVLADTGAQVHTIDVGATVLDAVLRMNEHGVGALLVTSGGKVAGVFTERDVLRRVVGRGLDPKTVPVREVMTREVVAVPPSVTVGEAMAIVTARRFRHLPVMEGGRLLGVVSAGDLTRWATLGQRNEIQQLTQYITGQYPA